MGYHIFLVVPHAIHALHSPIYLLQAAKAFGTTYKFQELQLIKSQSEIRQHNSYVFATYYLYYNVILLTLIYFYIQNIRGRRGCRKPGCKPEENTRNWTVQQAKRSLKPFISIFTFSFVAMELNLFNYSTLLDLLLYFLISIIFNNNVIAIIIVLLYFQYTYIRITCFTSEERNNVLKRTSDI